MEYKTQSNLVWFFFIHLWVKSIGMIGLGSFPLKNISKGKALSHLITLPQITCPHHPCRKTFFRKGTPYRLNLCFGVVWWWTVFQVTGTSGLESKVPLFKPIFSIRALVFQYAGSFWMCSSCFWAKMLHSYLTSVISRLFYYFSVLRFERNKNIQKYINLQKQLPGVDVYLYNLMCIPLYKFE